MTASVRHRRGGGGGASSPPPLNPPLRSHIVPGADPGIFVRGKQVKKIDVYNAVLVGERVEILI